MGARLRILAHVGRALGEVDLEELLEAAKENRAREYDGQLIGPNNRKRVDQAIRVAVKLQLAITTPSHWGLPLHLLTSIRGSPSGWRPAPEDNNMFVNCKPHASDGPGCTAGDLVLVSTG